MWIGNKLATTGITQLRNSGFDEDTNSVQQSDTHKLIVLFIAKKKYLTMFRSFTIGKEWVT